MCLNFKDLGIQFYTSELFEKLRDLGDDIFLKLPPPTSTSRRRASSSGPPPPPIHSMQNYYNQSSACFAGNCRVSIPGNLTKRCDEIQKGDVILTGNDATSVSRVECVVRSTLDNPSYLIKVGSLISTPYHPIKQQGSWVFPIDVGSKERFTSIDYVYSFLLEKEGNSGKRGESMLIENVQCITYAHGIQGDSVASHEFFGTENVVDVLQQMDGFETGLVTISGVQRGPTGRIQGFNQ